MKCYENFSNYFSAGSILHEIVFLVAFIDITYTLPGTEYRIVSLHP